MRFAYFVALAIASTVMAQDTRSPATSKEAFEKASIPADLHLKQFKPGALLDVSFPQVPQGSNQNPAPVPIKNDGAQLPENCTTKPPTFGLRVPGKPVNIGKGPFVIAIVDLDAPTPMRQFLGGGFTFKGDGVSLSNNTAAVTEYKPASLETGSKPHRSAFLLFDQPEGFKKQTDVNHDTGREAFNVSHFAEKVGLGQPIAGNFMLVTK